MPITDNMDICFGSKSNKEVWNTFFLAKLGLRCACRLSLIVEHKLLVPWPGIKPTSPTWEGELSTTGPPGKSLEDLSFPAIQNPKTLTLKMKYFKSVKSTGVFRGERMFSLLEVCLCVFFLMQINPLSWEELETVCLSVPSTFYGKVAFHHRHRPPSFNSSVRDERIFFTQSPKHKHAKV